MKSLVWTVALLAVVSMMTGALGLAMAITLSNQLDNAEVLQQQSASRITAIEQNYVKWPKDQSDQ